MEVHTNDYGFHFIKNSYFNELEKIGAPITYILDSNIIVDIEKLHYKGKSMDERKKEAIVNLLTREILGKEVGVNFCYALTELSCDYSEGGVHDKQYIDTQRAIKTILSKKPKKIINHSKYGEAKDKEFYSKENFGKISTVINKTLPLLFYSFIPMAKFFILLQQKQHTHKEVVFSEILEFMDKEIRAMTLYEIAAITYYLFTTGGERDHAENLMKVQKKGDLIRKIWNVSWDLTYLRYINDSASRSMSSEVSPNNFILITRDNALSGISNTIHHNSSIDFDGKHIPNSDINMDIINDRYKIYYTNLYNNYMSEEKFDLRRKFNEQVVPIDNIERLAEISETLIRLIEDKY